MARRCSGCGMNVPVGSRFCGACGAPAEAGADKAETGRSVPNSGDGGQSAPARTPERLPIPLAVGDVGRNPFRKAEPLGGWVRELMPNHLAAKIRSEAKLITGERREVSVLFVSVTGFDGAHEAVDSEDIYLITDEVMRLLVRIVYRFEGTVDKFTGNGLLALFGAPVTHENDPEQAVRAALAMQEELKPLQERCLGRFGLEFHLRFGVNTGIVIAGSLGSDLHMEYTVIGDTVNMAARLVDAADADGVLVSFSTYQRTRPLFDYRTLRAFHVKGKPEPIRAYEPLGLRANPDRVRGLAGLQVPMVGRQDMLEELLQTWALVQEQQKCRIALVTGDAGLGKSRLVAEFRRHLDAGVHVYQGSCLSYTRSTPFGVLGSLLRDILHLSDADSALAYEERIGRLLGELGLNGAELTPYILNVLGLEQPSPDLTARLSMMDAAMLQQQIHVVLLQVVRAEARRREIVLILEDIHWIDSASRNFLIELLRSSGDLPIFFLLVSRAYERGTVIQPVIALLERLPTWNVDLQLKALSPAQEYSLIDQLMTQAGVRLPSIHRQIARRAEGNPFFIEEIVRMLLDRAVEQERGQADGPADSPAGLLEATDAEALMNSVPGTLSGLILARFDSLDAPMRRVMQVAAVIGRSFSPSLLQQLLDSDEAEVSGLLSSLVERQFLVEEPIERELGYSFRHALIQEAVYSTLMNRTRRQLHGAVATALQSYGFLLPDEQTEALAYHYSHSDDPPQAIPYLVAAAQNATRRSAYETAIHFFKKALAQFETPPTPFSPVYCRIHVGLGNGLKLSGEFEEARTLLLHAYSYLTQYSEHLEKELPLMLELLRELADVCQRAGNFDTASEYLLEALALAGALEGSPLWYTLVERTAWVRFRLGELDECAQLARDAIQHLEEGADQQPFTLASFYNTMGGVCWQQGNLSEAITYVEASLKMYEPQGFVWGVSVACGNLGILHWTLGQWAAGTEWFERAAKIQEENGFSFELATSLRNLGYLRLAQGDTDVARHYLEQSLALCLQQNHSYGALATNLALGVWASEMGDDIELHNRLQAALAFEESADSESQIMLQLLSAQDLANQNRFDEAVAACNLALRLAEDGHMQAEMVESYHVLGHVYTRAGEFAQAEAALLKAKQVAEERNAPDRIAAAQLDLALLYERMLHAAGEAGPDRQQQALSIVRSAISQFEALGAHLKLRQARALEEKLVYHANLEDSWNTVESVQEPANLIRISHRPVAPPDAPHTPDGERAYVTILWLNLHLTGVQNEEDAFSRMAEGVNLVSRLLLQNEGHIIRHPQGIAAAFGAPVACEDGPTRAVNCAAALVERLDTLAQKNGGKLTYQIGLDHGEAVVGFLDADNRSLFVITGEPMTGAEKLAGLAPAGAIWLSDALARLVRNGYRFRPVRQPGNREYAGAVVEFVSASDGDGKRSQRRSRTRLIGRSDVLESLLQRIAALSSEGGGFVWLEGEAGMGKSRLLEELGERLDNRKMYIWGGTCSAQTVQQPFALFSTLLHDIFGFGAATSPEDRRARLRTGLGHWNANDAAVRPYLELLCGISPSAQDAQRLANLEPEALRRQIFVAVRTLLVGMTHQRPLVLLLDDLHWLDPVSASLLVFLSHLVVSLPVLFVFAHRPPIGEIALNELMTIRAMHEKKNLRIGLARLSNAESRMLLGELLPSGTLSLEAHRFILERSEGNPYYTEEFLRLLIEQGYLHQEGTVWSPQADTSLKDLPLPLTLDALIRSRVDNLPTKQRQLLQIAAVIGRPFTLQLLARLSPGLPVEESLQELFQRNLLLAGSGKDEWQFNHHIAQIVVYNSMLRVRLKALHLQVADVLEAEWGDAAEEHAEELAHHFSMAEESGRALRYLIAAGERAETRYANDEALSYYRRARDILQESAGIVADHLRWRVFVGLGDTYRFVGKYDLSVSALEEGLAMIRRSKLEVWHRAGIYRRLGQTCMSQGKPEAAYDHFRQALVALEEPEDRPGQIEAARTLYYLTYTHFRRGQWDKAKETCEMCRLYAEKTNDLSELAAAENLLGGIAYQQREREQAILHTEKAMELREQAGYTWGVASTLGNLAILAGESGDWDRAKSHFQRSLQLRHLLGDMEGVAIVNNNLGWLERVKGSLDEAEEHFRESLKVAEPLKMIYHAANAMLGIGHIRQIKGDLAEAQAMISGSVERAEEVDAQDLLSEVYRVQADILLAQGAVEEAEESARWAVQLASDTGSAGLEADAWRVVSECLLRQGLLHRAEAAVDLARIAQAETTDTIECGRVAIQAGRICCALNKLEEAHAEFGKAEQILTAIGAAYDLAILAGEQARLAEMGESTGFQHLSPVEKMRY